MMSNRMDRIKPIRMIYSSLSFVIICCCQEKCEIKDSQMDYFFSAENFHQRDTIDFPFIILFLNKAVHAAWVSLSMLSVLSPFSPFKIYLNYSIEVQDHSLTLRWTSVVFSLRSWPLPVQVVRSPSTTTFQSLSSSSTSLSSVRMFDRGFTDHLPLLGPKGSPSLRKVPSGLNVIQRLLAGLCFEVTSAPYSITFSIFHVATIC